MIYRILYVNLCSLLLSGCWDINLQFSSFLVRKWGDQLAYLINSLIRYVNRTNGINKPFMSTSDPQKRFMFNATAQSMKTTQINGKEWFLWNLNGSIAISRKSCIESFYLKAPQTRFYWGCLERILNNKINWRASSNIWRSTWKEPFRTNDVLHHQWMIRLLLRPIT